MDRAPTSQDVINFWLKAGRETWYRRDAAMDAEITARFAATHAAAAAGQLADWESTGEGTLALLLLLDQFSRNMFRDSARAFATDAAARAIADRAIARGFDASGNPALRRFFYVPFMHSEALSDQLRCIALCRAAGDAEGERYAVMHHAIIARFGRFPHRNEALGRDMSAGETAFLNEGGFAG